MEQNRISCTLSHKKLKKFTFSPQDSAAVREAMIRQVFGFPDGIPIIVKKHKDKNGEYSADKAFVSLMGLADGETYKVSLGVQERSRLLTEPTYLVLRSKKNRKKVEISVVQTEVDFACKSDVVNGLQLLCHMAVSWGISNSEGFDTSGSVFYVSSLDARCTLIKAVNMTLISSDHLPKDEAQTTTRTDTRGWNIGAEFSIPIDVTQAGFKVTGGYSSTESHQASATGMFATNHEYWPGQLDDVKATIPLEASEAINSGSNKAIDFESNNALLCKKMQSVPFSHEHRWQVELRHLMNGKLWSYHENKDIEVEQIPLEAFGNKTKDFIITYLVNLEDSKKDGTAEFLFSAIVSGRKTKSQSKVKRFDFRQVVKCELTLTPKGKMTCKYRVWKYTDDEKRGDLVPESEDGKEKRRQPPSKDSSSESSSE